MDTNPANALLPISSARGLRRKRWLIAFTSALASILAAVVLWLSKRPSDPIWNGKPVSQWVRAFVQVPGNSFSGTNDPALVTILEIGADAAPHLVKAVQKDPGFYASRLYRDVYRKVPLSVGRRLPVPVDKTNVVFRAYSSLAELGPAAKTAVPFLVTQFTETNHWIDYVRFALAAIGPEAREAVPILTNALHSTNRHFRFMAACALAKVQPDSPELIPATLRDLTSTNVATRRLACIVFGTLGPSGKAAIPALTEALKDEDEPVRGWAGAALWAIHPDTNPPPPLSVHFR